MWSCPFASAAGTQLHSPSPFLGPAPPAAVATAAVVSQKLAGVLSPPSSSLCLPALVPWATLPISLIHALIVTLSVLRTCGKVVSKTLKYRFSISLHSSNLLSITFPFQVTQPISISIHLHTAICNIISLLTYDIHLCNHFSILIFIPTTSVCVFFSVYVSRFVCLCLPLLVTPSLAFVHLS